MTTVFDFLNSINYNKKVIREDISVYTPYIINRTLSYHIDVIHYANEMNMYPNLDKDMQYDYLRLSIRPNKRFAKWIKKENLEDIKIIQEYYQCNIKRAEEILRLLTENQLEDLRKQ
jgi:hypothetical protein